MSESNAKAEAKKDVESTVDRLERLQRRSEAVANAQSNISRQYQTAPMSKEDKIAAGVIGTVFAGFIGLAIWLGVKDERRLQEEAEELRLKREAEEAERKRKREELEQWMEKQRNAGMIVQRLQSGEWMAIPADAYKEAEFRKS